MCIRDSPRADGGHVVLRRAGRAVLDVQQFDARAEPLQRDQRRDAADLGPVGVQLEEDARVEPLQPDLVGAQAGVAQRLELKPVVVDAQPQPVGCLLYTSRCV